MLDDDCSCHPDEKSTRQTQACQLRCCFHSERQRNMLKLVRFFKGRIACPNLEGRDFGQLRPVDWRTAPLASPALSLRFPDGWCGGFPCPAVLHILDRVRVSS